MATNGVQIKDAGTLDEALTGEELVAFQDPAGGAGSTKRTTTQAIADLASPGGGGVQSIVAGDNVTVDDTDPENPIVSATAGEGGGAVDSVNGQTGAVVLDAGDVGADAAGAAATAGAAAAAALAAHQADTTAIHGIADTSALVLTGDARLSDARTPTAHATSHQDGGSDELALDGSQITTGTVADARIASTLARDSEVTAAVAAEAALARNADNLNSGTVADARIAGTIARDSEVTAAVAAEAALARNADNLTSGTVADARIASTIARDSEVTNAVAAEVIARDAAIAAAIAALIAGAPGALDTLDELAAAFGDDANFAATMTTALSGKQPIDSDLTAIAALTTTSFGRALLEVANAAGLRTAAGLGTAATSNTGDFDAAGAAAAAQAASQPVDADLTAIAALATTSYGRAFLGLANAAAGLSALGLDADLATLSLPGSTTISSFGASLVDDADASAARSTLGLGTAATQASGAFDAAGAAAAAQAASQPLDSDLTAVGALTPSNDDVIQRKAGAWTNRTPAQLKTDLAISDSDINGLLSVLDLQTNVALLLAYQQARFQADAGRFVCSGLALVPDAAVSSPRKLDMAAGVAFQGTTEVVNAAQLSISTTIASLADATNPKWVIVELTAAKAVVFNQGTAAAAPQFPLPTATSVPLGFLYVPANATNVDTNLTTSNGLAKLYDARVLRSLHFARLIFEDHAATVQTYTSVTGVSSTIASSTFNKTAHGFAINEAIVFSGLSSTTGVTNGTTYFVSATGFTANAFRVSATSGGAAITLGGSTDAAIVATSVALRSLLAGVCTIPADSLSVGDSLEIEYQFFTTNNAAASAVQSQILANTGALAQFQSGSLATSALGRPHTVRVVMLVKAIGASGSIVSYARGSFGNIITNSAEAETHSSAAFGLTIDTTAAITIDCRARYAAAASGATITGNVVTITKKPAE